LREFLAEVHQRYGRSVFVAETGAEGVARVPWLRYVAGEVRAAVELDPPIGGICLYPIVDYLGWANGRSCQAGLLGRLDTHGQRPVYHPLAVELREQQKSFARLLQAPASRVEKGERESLQGELF
jgi:hypothetical protein